MERPEEHGVSFVTLYARVVRELATNPRVSQESLARNLDVTMRTVQRHLTQLEREGYIQIHRNKKPYTYTIAWERSLPHFNNLRVELFKPDGPPPPSPLPLAGGRGGLERSCFPK